MDRLASEMDQVMARMQAADERAGTYGGLRTAPERGTGPLVLAGPAGLAKSQGR